MYTPSRVLEAPPYSPPFTWRDGQYQSKTRTSGTAPAGSLYIATPLDRCPNHAANGKSGKTAGQASLVTAAAGSQDQLDKTNRRDSVITNKEKPTAPTDRCDSAPTSLTVDQEPPEPEMVYANYGNPVQSTFPPRALTPPPIRRLWSPTSLSSNSPVPADTGSRTAMSTSITSKPAPQVSATPNSTPRTCPPDHILRGLVQYVAFETSDWERGPMARAMSNQFPEAGLTEEQCRAYSLLVMDALNVATLHCQSQYLNGDTSHIRAVKNWASGVLRKADRLSPKRSRTRSVSSSASTREVPAGGTGNASVEPMPKRMKEGQGMAEFVDLAPIPDIHWGIEERVEAVVTNSQLETALPRQRDSGTGSHQKQIHHPPGQITAGKDRGPGRDSSPSVGYPRGMSAAEAGRLFPGPTIPKTTVRPAIPSLLSIKTGYEPGRFPPPVITTFRSSNKPTARGSEVPSTSARRWTPDSIRGDSRRIRLPTPSEESSPKHKDHK